jgi:outer membrane protein OmpA-like peptidoglycan-associated protein
MENVVRKDTRGKIEEIDAKYELLKRGQYEQLANPLDLNLDPKVPLELYEARNAVQIARASGADRYATDTFQKAEASLKQAEAYQARNAGDKPVTMTARQAVQTAEDARAIAVQRQEEEMLANERQAAADRELRAENERNAAQSETDRVKRNAEQARLDAQNEADRLKREGNARTAANQIESDRLKRANDAQLASAQSEADRLRLESDARAAAARIEADNLKRQNDADKAAAQASLDQAARDKAQAEAEKTELRAQLLQQFNAILETRDSARGLIVNISDVLFDTAKHSLRPGAREKLAKVAGVMSGHAGLKLEVEGHTDSVGSDEYNQHLSEQRGEAVSAYLAQQGMPSSSITTRGLGEGQPVASNDNAAGRQQNRRVELVVSGEIIGTQIGTPIAAIR